ncbi:MAG: PIN domain-containing protein [Desulfurococcales archaeon]|nr:PIN domain-containing protein [Desulfurococcales archaeon]
MDKDERRYAAVVLDANVVIAALIREQGFNRYIVSLTPSIYPSYHPKALRSEILEHAGEIARRAGRSEYEIRLGLQTVLERVKPLPDEKVAKYLSEAHKFVKDPEDTVYVATALYLRNEERFKQAILVTWNKRDYDFWPLMKRWVRVLDPKEFYTNYLRPLPPPIQTQCLICKVASLERAVEAALLYIGEHQYLVVNAEPPTKIEVETPCHMILIEWSGREEGYCISPQLLTIRECIEKAQQPMTEKRLQEIEQARQMCKP